jgi:hypothetical protein
MKTCPLTRNKTAGINKMIEEPWIPGLTLKTLLNWDLYRNKYLPGGK